MSDEEKGKSEGLATEATEVRPSAGEAPAEPAVEEAAVAEAAIVEAGMSTAAEEPAPAEKPGSGAEQAPSRQKRPESFFSRYFFVFIGVTLLIEMFVYGMRGEIDVCVGKDKTHDFELIGQARTDKNRSRFPVCERRENLGMMSHYDDGVSAAKKVACHRVVQIRNRGEAPQCIKSSDGWRFRVDAKQVWAWDSRLWKAILHLD